MYRALLNKYTLPSWPATCCATKAEPQITAMMKRVRSALSLILRYNLSSCLNSLNHSIGRNVKLRADQSERNLAVQHVKVLLAISLQKWNGQSQYLSKIRLNCLRIILITS